MMRRTLFPLVAVLLVAPLAGVAQANGTLDAGGPYLGAVNTAIAFDATGAYGPNVYEWVRPAVRWSDARSAAEARTYPGSAGPAHLATITSQEEHDAVLAAHPEGEQLNAWLGGFQDPAGSEPAGGWQWVTGEPWGYTNWGAGEPNDNGGSWTGADVLASWPLPDGSGGFDWVDWVDSSNWLAPYIVEYENCSGVYDWDFGDGTQALDAGPTPTHSYSEAGIYNVSVTVTNVTGSTTYNTIAVVYDPTGGFVTGGGWIDSPAGAYVADPSLAGKATFGFVSKYLKGASVPTGNTEFQFHAAGLNFHSDSYEWLVVTGSDYAMFKGIGTISGEGAYKFKVWAGDGTGTDGADTFRIRIWEEDGFGVETDAYDNGTDQHIAGGNIVVHTR